MTNDIRWIIPLAVTGRRQWDDARQLLALGSPVAIRRFLRVLPRVRTHTLLGVARLAALYRLGRLIERDRIDGAVVECGVFEGGSAAVLGNATRRPLWLFDSFSGLPPPTAEDGPLAHTSYRPGWCAATIDRVRAVLDATGVARDRVHIVPGFFADTFPQVDPPAIALLHVDADWYDSVRLSLDKFYDAVARGGVVVLDDYGHWEGCRRAVDEFFARRGIKARLHTTDYTGRYFRKP